MATYSHGSSEIQADSAAGLQTLYLMTPNTNYFTATGYSETHYHALHHTQSQPHQYIHNNNSGLLLLNDGRSVNPPLPVVVGSTISEDLSRSFSSSPRFHYNSTMWAPHDNKSSMIPAGTGTHQGLSLSLSYCEQAGLSTSSMARPAPVITNGNGRGDTSAYNNNIVMGSKYLKAAQQLLDEVAKVAEDCGGGEKIERSNTIAGRGEEGSDGGESTGKQRGHELTTAYKQELQMKKAKLVNMLDEVEQGYKQYHHQMRLVVSSFEQAAGIGSTRSYTALALRTISKQFRCLKDAITAQIKAAAGGLGDQDYNDYGSRLKFVDRQQRALHAQHHHNINAWRPQRGLPETAVSVLRAWLFEHFLHPYPKDSDKHMLAKQTGLTRSQVSNWFINARVRLWKPMVEEMYLEEMKQHDQEISPKHTNNESLASPQSKSISPNHQLHSTQTKGRLDPPQTRKRSKLSENNNNNNNNDVGSFGGYINPLIGSNDQLAGGGFHDFLSNQMVQTSHYGGFGGDGGIMGGVSPPLHSRIIENGYDHTNNNSEKRFVAWGK